MNPVSDPRLPPFEWCADWCGTYPAGDLSDPIGPASGSDRVFRGGSWGSVSRYCRSAYRGRYAPGRRYDDLGFRVLIEAE